MSGHLLVMAKAPVPGRVKTRLCPPCTPEQAARIAHAALLDTLATGLGSAAGRRTLVVDGPYDRPLGWRVRAQCDGPLGIRLAHAFAGANGPAVLVGMDTPQLTTEHLDDALGQLADPLGPDAVFGPAVDGGWWLLGLRDPAYAVVLRDIATSTATTGADTLAALLDRRLHVTALPALRDVDEIADAHLVAAECHPWSRFARTMAAEVAS